MLGAFVMIAVLALGGIGAATAYAIMVRTDQGEKTSQVRPYGARLVEDYLRALTIVRWQIRSTTLTLAGLILILIVFLVTSLAWPRIVSALALEAVSFSWIVAILTIGASQVLILARVPPEMDRHARKAVGVVSGLFSLLLLALLMGLTLECLSLYPQLLSASGAKLPIPVISAAVALVLFSSLSFWIMNLHPLRHGQARSDDWSELYEPIHRAWERPHEAPRPIFANKVLTRRLARMTFKNRFLITVVSGLAGIACLYFARHILDKTPIATLSVGLLYLAGAVCVLAALFTGCLSTPVSVAEMAAYWRSRDTVDYPRGIRLVFAFNLVVLALILMTLLLGSNLSPESRIVYGCVALVAGGFAVSTFIASRVYLSWIGQDWSNAICQVAIGLAFFTVAIGIQRLGRQEGLPPLPLASLVASLIVMVCVGLLGSKLRLILDRPLATTTRAIGIDRPTLDWLYVNLSQQFAISDLTFCILEGQKNGKVSQTVRASDVLTTLVTSDAVRKCENFELYYFSDLSIFDLGTLRSRLAAQKSATNLGPN